MNKIFEDYNRMKDNTDPLNGIAVFSCVVEAGGFSNAARRLGHSPSFISNEVGRLEKRLGIRLLNRTTRSLSLTAEGRVYHEKCREILEIAEDANAVATQNQSSPRGLLRVSSPVSFGLSHLRRELPQFIESYPDVTLDISFNERTVNIVAEGYDIALCVWELADSNLIARKLMDSRRVLVK
jgi:DNA-binding transcriptional LysR family regulator